MNPSVEAPVAGVKRVAILQSSYIPWKGYFDIINLVDEFILYDDRQYTKRDWRNRNVIKTAQGLQWLSIPVQVKGRYHQRIDETLIADPSWPARHWERIKQAYGHAAYFNEYRYVLGTAFAESPTTRLSLVNRHFLEVLGGLLGIRTTLSWSTDYPVGGDRTERLVNLCRAAGAREYLSGPSARTYIDDEQFERAGIRLIYMDYSGYPEYPQLHGSFVHEVSILDLLFNTGPEAARYMKSFASFVKT